MTESPQRKSPMPLVLGLAVALVCALGAVWVSARPSDNGGGAGAKPSTTVSAPDAGTSTPTVAGTTGPAGQGPTPKGATSLGSAVLVHDAPAGAAAVTLFVDPQCPICAKFESIFGKEISDLAAKGTISVSYHVMSFLDRNLKNDSSARGANAMFCAADAGKMGEYVQALMAGQPAQEGDGFTDAALSQFATTAGISGDALATFSSCLTGRTYAAQVAASEASAEAAGVRGTPTVMVDGKVMDLGALTADNLAELIAAAHK